ncbi:MAG: hypothetical protein ACYDCL_12685 [Myxococcales bacterium]
MLSDWYWLEAIQYYGTKANEAERFRHLAGYLEDAVALDPDFGYLYQFGGDALPFHDAQTKLWYNTGAAIRLLEEGVQSKSTRWQIPFLLGYLLYTFRGDYQPAGRDIEMASKRPRAPAYLASLGVRLLAQGGSTASAIEITQAALAEARDEKRRDELENRLKALVLQLDLERLNRALAARRQAGLPISGLGDLVGFASLDRLPKEPYGGEFRLSAAADRVVSSDDDKLLRIYVHPGEAALEPAAD